MQDGQVRDKYVSVLQDEEVNVLDTEGLISKLRGALESIPDQYRTKNAINVTLDDYSDFSGEGSHELCVGYNRPLTEDELALDEKVNKEYEGDKYLDYILKKTEFEEENPEFAEELRARNDMGSCGCDLT